MDLQEELFGEYKLWVKTAVPNDLRPIYLAYVSQQNVVTPQRLESVIFG